MTLGIIGIVAALTLPSVVNSYKNRRTVAKVKKVYSTMNQALYFAITENGEVSSWNLPNVNSNTESKDNTIAFASYILPYLKILKDCGVDKQNCMLEVDYKFLNGTNWNNYSNNRYKYYYKIILNDGSYLVMRLEYPKCNGSGDGVVGDKCGWFLLDVNGDNKPNVFGKDVFLFVVRNNALTPAKSDDCDKNSSKRNCTGAAAYIMTNDNMDYLKN